MDSVLDSVFNNFMYRAFLDSVLDRDTTGIRQGYARDTPGIRQGYDEGYDLGYDSRFIVNNNKK